MLYKRQHLEEGRRRRLLDQLDPLPLLGVDVTFDGGTQNVFEKWCWDCIDLDTVAFPVSWRWGVAAVAASLQRRWRVRAQCVMITALPDRPARTSSGRFTCWQVSPSTRLVHLYGHTFEERS